MPTNLVIVESPAKAKTIQRYLGDGWEVEASVGHIRDLPKRNPKGSKAPVPGVDLENDFSPTYEVSADSKKVVTKLRKLAKAADTIWFATDLDREGEAIAWHLAECLKVDPLKAHRVTFNAITKAEITAAFSDPTPINMDRVNAQQARRIIDRIVGYQVSPLLWQRVAGGLSAGRVQSPAVRLIVEREQLIRAFIPDEYWQGEVRLTQTPDKVDELAEAWHTLHTGEEVPTKKTQAAWLTGHQAISAQLASFDGGDYALKLGHEDWAADGDAEKAHRARVLQVADALGIQDPTLDIQEDAEGKGPAARLLAIEGSLDPDARWRVTTIQKKQSKSRPHAPFITSSLQAAAANTLGFTARRTMGAAQGLYQGVAIPGEGQIGLITYMRTDSTHVAPEAIEAVREFIQDEVGQEYLPEKPVAYHSANRQAQEAHEAIRPTDPTRRPEDLPKSMQEDQRRLYSLIWRRFVSGQMVPAIWDRTEFRLRRSDRDAGAELKVAGRALQFDGWYRIAGIPSSDGDQILPDLSEGDELSPFAVEPRQRFTSPPSRFTESALIKQLEREGIGRPSTYASIIEKIQQKYIEKIDRSFHPTAVGEVVTEKLIDAFPRLMDVGYTRSMESDLDKIASADADLVQTLKSFYGPFADSLAIAYETMTHARAEMTPADWKCPDCGARTAYRLARSGRRFLSCSTYPDCTFATGVDRDGKPQLEQRVNVACPEDGSPMILRQGRFGPFMASVNYPDIKMVLNLDKNGGLKIPAVPPLKTELECEKCGKPLNLRMGKRGPWLGCSSFPKCRGRGKWTTLDEETKASLESALEAHEKANPRPVVTRLDGDPIPEGTPVSDLLLPGEDVDLERFEE
ncbi:MAG: type I DNA topoisomerase [Planctomycetes bacterium]|jgi:DNA topoisomerase-1|nr:type I DNA topoisomerase [Planctomycetota bacterium]MCP4838766.1 type I DNA topoisomerase [Planctomycetota bacterium]